MANYLNGCDMQDPCITCGCTDKLIDNREAEICCNNCGTVFEQRMIDMQPEYRCFANDSGGHAGDPSRVGGPVQESGIPRMTLGCSIEQSTAVGKRIAYISRRSNAAVCVTNELGRKLPSRGVVEFLSQQRGLVSNHVSNEAVCSTAEEIFCAYIDMTKHKNEKQKALYMACLRIAWTYHTKTRDMPERILAIEAEMTKNLSKMYNNIHAALGGDARWKMVIQCGQAKFPRGWVPILKMIQVCGTVDGGIRTHHAEILCRSRAILSAIWEAEELQARNIDRVNFIIVLQACKMHGIVVDKTSLMAACKKASFKVPNSKEERDMESVVAAVAARCLKNKK